MILTFETLFYLQIIETMRFKKLLLLGGGLTTAGVVNLARNDWDINSIGVIRLGRAVYTVD